MSNELAVIQKENSLLVQQATPEEWAARRQQFNSWVNSQLHKGIDFGELPNVKKPSLFKPGAEKIVQLFGCLPDAEITYRDQNAETGYLYVEVTVAIINLQTGNKVGAGVGSCSTNESKYRWRKEWWNGQGAPVGDDWERTSNNKWYRKVANTDLADVWNTVLKMAKKRALVDAALSISGASEKFTQDVEDMDDNEPVVHESKPAAKVIDQSKSEAEEEPWKWVLDKARTDKFFKLCAEKFTLTDDQVLEALPAPDGILAYRGSPKDAMNAIQVYVDKKAA